MSNNTGTSDFVIVDIEGKQRVSNNARAADFVMPWVSPVSQRRSLRSSREIHDEAWAEEVVQRGIDAETPVPLLRQRSWHAPFEQGAAFHPVVLPRLV